VKIFKLAAIRRRAVGADLAVVKRGQNIDVQGGGR
jgi:hypothetical protein